MGCKPRHALLAEPFLRSDDLVSADKVDDSKGLHPDEASNYIDACLDKVDDRSNNKRFELYKKRTTIVVRRKSFLDVACDALTEYKYMGPNQRADLAIACRIRERKESVTNFVLFLSSMKSTYIVIRKQNPLLWASTYHAGEYLDPVAVAEAKEKWKANKSSEISTPPLQKEDGGNGVTVGKSPLEGISSAIDVISSKQMAIEGYKAQSEMVIDSLDRFITAWEKRKESVVVEGVHLSLNFVPVYTLGSFADGTGTPMYGPLHIGKAEPIYLQFGQLGISAWLSDAGGGTSHASSFDETRGELTDNGSRCFSSCCTSLRFSDGHAKELKEEQSVHGSDDDEELEGSVDEDYTQSDEEYDDLAMLGIQENSYFTDDSGKDTYNKFDLDEIEEQKYKQNTDHFRSKSERLSVSMFTVFLKQDLD
ncbi:hypothetical protein RND71_015083 [Anisodus tanguticus]|uniref:Uncharacterized protein n=1 Tax=Anisodus tanguticus TaxID=243964 RepID=A0AAE1SD42_9SOLA|nr:hypothetical protein RND71_015083 [Anisodus tanguticus]